MEKYLEENFTIPAKNSSTEAKLRWRRAVTIVKNHKRRFRNVANLEKRSEAEEKRKEIKGRIRIVFVVHTAALTFIDAGKRSERRLSPEAQDAGFAISPRELESIVRAHDLKKLREYGGIEGISVKILVSLKDGVSESELYLRRSIFGCNEYVEKPPKSFFLFVWEALHDLTLIILIICAVVSIAVGLVTEGWPKGMYDGLGILVSIFLVVIVTAISDYKQSLQFRDLDKEKKKVFVQLTRDSNVQKVSINDLVVGDVVNLSTGDLVPADGLFISGTMLVIDESSLSGESEPVVISKEKPFLLAGTKVQEGIGNMLVTSVGMRTEWGKLMETLCEGGEDETPLQVKLNGVATIIGKIGLGFAVLTFFVLLGRFFLEKGLHHESFKWSSDALKILDYFAVAITIIVVAVPEGLPLAVTLSLAFAMKKLMNDMALVRHLSACETMGSASCICTDKTGTLTTNHMEVDKIWICEEVTCVKNSADKLKSSIPESILSILLQNIFQNSNCQLGKLVNGKAKILGTPTESAILEFGLLLGGDFDYLRRASKIIKVEPFNSDRKKMSVILSQPGGEFRAYSKGASEIILGMCDKIVDKKGNVVSLTESHRKNAIDVINSLAGEALRTLSLAFKDINEYVDRDSIPEEGFTLISVVGIKDPVRPGVVEAVQSCITAGITVRMVTGDNINTAKAIAKECGILTDGDLAIEGSDFRAMSPHEMMELMPRIKVMARSLPSDKYKLVKYLRHVNEVVAVTGDGTNDAPALNEADIGLAMGIAGTEVAKGKADVIIMDDNFATIINVAKWGRAVYINIQKFVQFQMTVNIVALIVNFASACVIGSAPLTAVQLLWVNMIMDTLGALALATEPPNEDLMKRPPIGRGVSFITKTMWRNIIGQSVYQLLVLGLLMFDGKQLLNLNGSDSNAVLNTFIFNSFVFCQIFNEINSRDVEKINVLSGMLTNWVFMIIIASTVVFQIVIVEVLGTFASTVPLSWHLWLLSILIGFISMIIAVGLKCIPVETVKLSSSCKSDGYEPLPSGPELL